MKVVSILVIPLLAYANLRGQVVTELYATPSAGEPEWVEIYNPRTSALSLNGWMLCDSRTCCTIRDVIVPPKEYVVLTKDVEALAECRTVEHVAYVSLPSLNNSVDMVMLRNEDSLLVDSMQYSMRNLRKWSSIERDGVWRNGDVVYGATFAASLGRDSATCGYTNSVVVLERDLRVAGWRTNGYAISIHVVNYGQHNTDACRLHVSIGDVRTEWIIHELYPKQTQAFSIDISSIHGLQQLVAWHTLRDDRSENDTAEASIEFVPEPGSVSITEVLFDPYDTQCDYVELYSTLSDTLDVLAWTIEDAEHAPVQIGGAARLFPRTYTAFGMDSTIFSMASDTARGNCLVITKPVNVNAQGDDVIVKTSSGFVVDSIHLDVSMHVEQLPEKKGISLEKLHPSLQGTSATSWTSSADLSGGTPGRANSVELDFQPQPHVAISPNPCTSNEWDRRYPCGIQFQQPFQHATIGVRILDQRGHHVAWVLNSIVAGSDVVVVWNARDDLGEVVPAGPYIAYIQCVDLSSKATYTLRAVVVVGS